MHQKIKVSRHQEQDMSNYIIITKIDKKNFNKRRLYLTKKD